MNTNPVVIIGGLKHETNTFSVVNTNLDDFNPLHGIDIKEFYKGTRTEIGGFIDSLTKHDVDYIFTTSASATPSGPMVENDFKTLVGFIIDGIAKYGEIDGVLLALHGAMVAEGFPEAEGYLLEAVRDQVGQETPIIITLDLHGLICDSIVGNVDAIFGFDTNPHVDMYERGIEAANAMYSTLAGEIAPVTYYRKLRMMPPTINQRTGEGPMVKLLAKAREMEKDLNVINVCLFPAFPYADILRVGSSVVAVTDDDPDMAEKLSSELGQFMWSIREEFLKPLTPIKDAVNFAIKNSKRPIILADVADNPGGGAPGDGTEILRELLEKDAKDTAIAVIKDPDAVREALKVGVSAKFEMSIGGKTDDFHGKPVHVEGIVRTITDGRFIHKAMSIGTQANVGKTAVIDVDGIEIILTEKSHAPNDPKIYRRNGIEPKDKKILVLKSRGHFRAAYSPFTEEILEVDASGITTPNLEHFTYRNIPRPIWPLDNI